MVATIMFAISLALLRRIVLPRGTGASPEDTTGYAVPEYCANFSSIVIDPIAGVLTMMNVDMLEFQPLDASPVYAPAEADAMGTVSVWVLVRVSVRVSVEDRVR